MTGALALVAALTISSQLQTHPTGLPSVGPSRANSLRTAPIMDKLYEQAGKPALDFDFARYKDLHDNASGATSLINFSRSAAQSPGTYVGSDGLIHDAAVNLALYSEQFDNAWWSKIDSTVTANQAIAPDGKQTADKITATASPGRIRRTSLGNSTDIYSWSIWVKSATGSDVAGQLDNGGLDIATFTATNEWQRVEALFQTTGVINAQPGLRVTNSGDSLYVWGGQFELADPATMQPTAYIKTTSQALAAPRFDHVPTTGNVTTNLLTYSEMLDLSSAWSRSGVASVSANAQDAPDGTTTAETITVQSGSGAHYIAQAKTTTPATHTFSVYAKAGTHNFLQLTFGTQSAYANFNLSTGTTGTSSGITSSTITEAGNGWYRCSVEYVNVNTTSFVLAIPSGASDARLASWSATGSETIHVYGAQLEASPTPGPYVRTLSETRSISDANAESLGLLVEEARANLLTNSEIFNSGYSKQGVTVTDNFSTAPSGQFTASGFFASGTTGAGGVYRSATTTTNQGISFFVKSGTKNWVQLITGNGSQAAWFDLSTATIGTVNAVFTSTNIEDHGNGWFRISAARPHAASSLIGIRFVDANNSAGYSGATVGDLLGQAFGAQLEEATFPTSYIPTVTSQYRYADVAAVQDEDFSTTNLLAYSESFDVGWGASRLEPITANATTAPNGTTTADYVEQQSGQTNAGVVNQSVSVSGDFVYGVYAKAKEKTFVRLALVGGTNALAYFDLSDCSVGTTANSPTFAYAESAGNGWCKLSMGENSSGSILFAMYLADTDNSSTVTDSGGIYLWGASHTATEYPVEYVTTRNLLTDSQDFERGAWAKLSGATIDNDVAQAPDGTLTADRLNFTGSLSRIEQPISLVSTTYVVSVWMRTESGLRTVGIRPASGTPFDVTVTTDWQRFQYSASTAGGLKYPLIISNTTSTDPVLIWGMQVEPGTTATDYVRTVDVVGKDYQWYEPTEGTVFAEADKISDYPNSAVGSFESDANNVIAFGHRVGATSANTASAWIRNSGSTEFFRSQSNSYDGWKMSLAFKYNDGNMATDGTIFGAADTAMTLPIASRLQIGKYATVTSTLNGHIKRLTYWPVRQSDSTLQVITE